MNSKLGLGVDAEGLPTAFRLATNSNSLLISVRKLRTPYNISSAKVGTLALVLNESTLLAQPLRIS